MTARSLQAYAPQVQAEINVTPLVDVMLALVVILMITAPLALHRIPLPLGAPHGGQVPRTLSLSVKSTGELYLDGSGINHAQLASALTAAANADNPPLLDVKPEASASYDDVANVLALAKRSGVSAIRIEGAQ
ncbi:MAG: biopolymer transporter ExbD [Dokdonella sp.]